MSCNDTVSSSWALATAICCFTCCISSSRCEPVKLPAANASILSGFSDYICGDKTKIRKTPAGPLPRTVLTPPLTSPAVQTGPREVCRKTRSRGTKSAHRRIVIFHAILERNWLTIIPRPDASLRENRLLKLDLIAILKKFNLPIVAAII